MARCKQDGGRLEVKECSQPRPQGLLAFQKTLGTRLGMFRVFVELSLEEMLRQQQSKACLYHGRDVFKEMSRSFFTGKCAFVATLEHYSTQLLYAR